MGTPTNLPTPTPTPEPSPSPEPRPTAAPGIRPEAPPEGSNQAMNMKKVAMGYVLGTVNEAIANLDADAVASGGGTAKSASLIAGLGGDGSVWKSTLAETIRQQLVSVIDSATSQMTTTQEEIIAELDNEPTYVDKDDPRARWYHR